MTKTIFVERVILALVATLLMALTACGRKEADPTIARAPSVAPIEVTPPISPSPQATSATNILGHPVVADLLQRVVRADLPGMTFDQVKALFPAACVGNDANRSISCPDVTGLISVSYSGGPDGIFDMVFSGGMASCKILKKLMDQKLGERGSDNSDQDADGVCDVHWWKINPTNKAYYAYLAKQKGDDEVTLQIGAEQGP